MRKLFERKKGHASIGPIPRVPEGWTPVQSPAQLLTEPHRQRLLERIWQYTALSPGQFEQLYRRPLLRYAEYVQLLPASESHHHAYAGGMLDHGLELVATALKLRQSHLLPATAAPEDQAVQADAWSAAIAYGALLHDIGKVAVDLEVECLAGRRWHPWHGPLEHAYRFRYVTGRDYKLHNVAAGLIFAQILDQDILDWLSTYPMPWCSLLYVLAGQYEYAGVLGELVTQADRISTAQNVGGNPTKALQAPVRSLQHHLLSALRHLVKSELKLNQAGAAGWLTNDALWLVSKVAADKIRAYLLSESIDGVPSSNIALFDELQSHGLVEATSEGKAIWKATVVDGDWQQQFTFLRLQPALIWADESRPPEFFGTVDPVLDIEPDQTLPLVPIVTNAPSPLAPYESTSHNPRSSEPPGIYPPEADDSDYLGPLLELFHTPDSAQSPPLPSAPTAKEQSSDLGRHFLEWLRTGLQNHALLINDSRAKVHTVNGTYFLVTPGIFQRYAMECHEQAADLDRTEAWPSVQKGFEKMNFHRRRPNGENIWTCHVQGPRKRGKLNGYLMKDPLELSQDGLTNNPFLSLIET
ncbi:MobH family relaxase [Pseudomonas syringae]|uniref:MobH family relaxase n=3 Tax=Pseudomonas syringae TaxID=317 RepID=UPI001F253B98|nr:MobH family relaxase [Pseudomonas syringae]MCF5244233.1 relaxase [Pseudomonas syringae]